MKTNLIPPVIPESIARIGVPPAPPASMVEDPDEAAARLARGRATRLSRFESARPKRYIEANVSTLDPEQDPGGAVSGWLASGHQTLLLASPKPGVGKSHAAYAVGAQAAAEGLVVEAWTLIELLGAMRRAMNDESARDPMHDVLTADLVVLDDLGRENDGRTSWPLEQVHLILDVRLRERGRTVVTTNLTSEQIGDRYGHPTLDRLIDDAVIVKMTGPSRRKAAVSW